MKSLFLFVACIGLALSGSTLGYAQSNRQADRIQPYRANPYYWQYQGSPILLLGGTNEDNLFQMPDVEEHLDELRAVGGNYVRNTMSSRDEGNLWPFAQQADGRYNLEAWNDAYWQRLDRFLDATAARGIIVQLEVWDKWDMATDNWSASPWYPGNNINYTLHDTKLKGHYGDFMLEAHDFFNSVPALHDDRVLHRYQQRFVDKLLSHTLAHDHILYTVSNELHPTFSHEWGVYWATYIHRAAQAAGTTVEVTEMFWTPDPRAKDHRIILNRPELFGYFEASQNTSNKTFWQHWRHLQWVREALADAPRPINIVKIYDGDVAPGFMWHQILAGAASSRFHRPRNGIGLNAMAQANLKSLRMWLDEYDVFTGVSDGDSGYRGGHMLLTDRERGEAYVHYRDGEQYSVYFRAPGDVGLMLPEGTWTLRWLDVDQSQWREAETITSTGEVRLTTPTSGSWLALFTKAP
ncbi:MAG: hypothetical protein RhofKO_01320 [Rhodothermales bacterium]